MVQDTAQSIAALLQQGVAYHRQGQLPAAEQVYRQILAAQPNHFDALQLLGMIAHATGDLAIAEELFRKSLTANFKQPAVWYNLANLLFTAQRFADSIAAYDRALRLRPTYAEAFGNRSAALTASGRPDEALMSANRALALKPDYIEAHSNRSAALVALKRFDEALASAERALALAPNNAENIYNRGRALMGLNRLNEAVDDFTRVSGLDPHHVRAHFNEGVARLTMGDMPRGWNKYEWRWLNEPLIGRKPQFTQPEWNGENASDKRLFVYGEQGLGDVLQFFRYLPLVSARAAHVIALVPTSLKSLLSGRVPGVEVVSPGDPLPPFDVQCALLSLPRIFQTSLATLPAQAPDMAAPNAHVASWEARLGPKTATRVGVVWAGNANHPNDRFRSMDVKRLAPLLDCGCQLFSLQKDLRHGEQRWLDKQGVRHFGPEIGDFADTAALISLMDVVISVDTSVAHLSGAMGKQAWVLLPFIDADWRWMLDRDDSPWYPTVRLFRQSATEDWDGVIARVAQELSKRVTL